MGYNDINFGVVNEEFFDAFSCSKIDILESINNNEYFAYFLQICHSEKTDELSLRNR